MTVDGMGPRKDVVLANPERSGGRGLHRYGERALGGRDRPGLDLASRLQYCRFMRTSFLVYCALTLVACGANNQSSGAPSGGVEGGVDAEPILESGVDAADASFFTSVALENQYCLPIPLPANAANGLANCRVLLGVPGACEASEGLSPATAADVAKVHAQAEAIDASVPAGSVCVLTQVAASSTPGTGCTDQQTPGWCYARSSCRADAGGFPCQYAACQTAEFATIFGAVEAGIFVDYWGSWLACP